MQRHLVVFAKAPCMGRVKHRLARDIGPVSALRFHYETTAALLRRLDRDRRWRTWLALTPDRAACGPRYWKSAAARIPQGSGALGERMQRALRQIPAGPVVIIGSDIPAITAAHVWSAFRALGSHDLVFGPAADGGYWLVGARRRPFMPALFRQVRWSTEHALADTLAGAPPRVRIAFVATLEDIDDLCALRRWKAHEGRER
jgi:rSAM/selenodomain-associated transferase 1